MLAVSINVQKPTPVVAEGWSWRELFADAEFYRISEHRGQDSLGDFTGITAISKRTGRVVIVTRPGHGGYALHLNAGRVAGAPGESASMHNTMAEVKAAMDAYQRPS